MKKILAFIFLSINFIFAQNYSVSGYIKELSTGEVVMGATVISKEIKKNAVSNTYGFYSISLPKGNHTLVFSSLGLKTKILQINLDKNVTENIDLEEETDILSEAVVVAEYKKSELDTRGTQMGVNQISGDKVKQIPVLFGEADIMKVVQLMPGVSSMGEGSTGFVVRGGGPDQNLILLDEAPVYNASHLAGFFSVFNSDAIKNMELMKGSQPAKYGGRISSVMDISMKDGNMKQYDFTGGIGLISSRLTVEGPIQEGKSSFIVSGRRTYFDLFLPLSGDTNLRGTKLYFYDLNMKINFQLSDNDRLFVSGYFGRDVFKFENLTDFSWGNSTATIRWNHIYSGKLFSNTTFVYSNYEYANSISSSNDQSVKMDSYLQDISLKQDYDFFTEEIGKIHFGFNVIYHNFIPGVNISIIGGMNDFKKMVTKRDALESAIYISNELNLFENLNIHYGLRASFFKNVGKGKYFNIENGKILGDTITNGSELRGYFGLEPRVSFSYSLDDDNSIKSSYTRNFQYINLLSNTSGSSPMDIWIPSSNIIKPQIADQVAIGYFFNFLEKEYEASTEIFYKNLQNQIEYRPGSNIQSSGDVIERELLFGKGRSYGIEFFLKKNKGAFNGWISYTLSRSFRTFDEIDNGREFPYRYDKIHNISVVLNYVYSDKLDFSSNWVFMTGDAVSFPSGSYNISGMDVIYYGSRNSGRMPNYHRLDLGCNYYITKTKQREVYWSFSIYNAYFRQNPWSIDFEEKKDTNGREKEAIQTSLFSIVPSVSFNFKF